MTPLPTNLSHITLPPTLILPDELPFPFYDELDFYNELCLADTIDVLTYSASPLPLPFARVIYCEGTPPRRAKSLRVSGTHAKLWLLHTRSGVTAYIGSANATAMTLNELLYKCTPSQSRKLHTYFNNLWDANQPK